MLALLPPAARREAEQLINELSARPESLEEFTARAEAAFEHQMKPVRDALVSALQSGDIEALKGLRALLPHLLGEAIRDETLSDLFAYQLGRAFLDGYLSPEGGEVQA